MILKKSSKGITVKRELQTNCLQRHTPGGLWHSQSPDIIRTISTSIMHTACESIDHQPKAEMQKIS